MDLTTEDTHQFRHPTIEELKSKLGEKDIIAVRQSTCGRARDPAESVTSVSAEMMALDPAELPLSFAAEIKVKPPWSCAGEPKTAVPRPTTPPSTNRITISPSLERMLATVPKPPTLYDQLRLLRPTGARTDRRVCLRVWTESGRMMRIRIPPDPRVEVVEPPIHPGESTPPSKPMSTSLGFRPTGSDITLCDEVSHFRQMMAEDPTDRPPTIAAEIVTVTKPPCSCAEQPKTAVPRPTTPPSTNRPTIELLTISPSLERMLATVPKPPTLKDQLRLLRPTGARTDRCVRTRVRTESGRMIRIRIPPDPRVEVVEPPIHPGESTPPSKPMSPSLGFRPTGSDITLCGEVSHLRQMMAEDPIDRSPTIAAEITTEPPWSCAEEPLTSAPRSTTQHSNIEAVHPGKPTSPPKPVSNILGYQPIKLWPTISLSLERMLATVPKPPTLNDQLRLLRPTGARTDRWVRMRVQTESGRMMRIRIPPDPRVEPPIHPGESTSPSKPMSPSLGFRATGSDITPCGEVSHFRQIMAEYPIDRPPILAAEIKTEPPWSCAEEPLTTAPRSTTQHSNIEAVHPGKPTSPPKPMSNILRYQHQLIKLWPIISPSLERMSATVPKPPNLNDQLRLLRPAGARTDRRFRLTVQTESGRVMRIRIPADPRAGLPIDNETPPPPVATEAMYPDEPMPPSKPMSPSLGYRPTGSDITPCGEVTHFRQMMAEYPIDRPPILAAEVKTEPPWSCTEELLTTALRPTTQPSTTEAVHPGKPTSPPKPMSNILGYQPIKLLPTISPSLERMLATVPKPPNLNNQLRLLRPAGARTDRRFRLTVQTESGRVMRIRIPADPRVDNEPIDNETPPVATEAIYPDEPMPPSEPMSSSLGYRQSGCDITPCGEVSHFWQMMDEYPIYRPSIFAAGIKTEPPWSCAEEPLTTTPQPTTQPSTTEAVHPDEPAPLSEQFSSSLGYRPTGPDITPDSILCWRCGEMGHFHSDCTVRWRLFCSRCKRTGVVSHDCACLDEEQIVKRGRYEGDYSCEPAPRQHVGLMQAPVTTADKSIQCELLSAPSIWHEGSARMRVRTSRFGDIRTEEGESRAAMIPERPHKSPSPPAVTEHGLIMPRKPPNPVKENTERQSLHKELLFNQRIGKNVLNQKTELQRVLARQKDHIAKKELENNTSGNTPELEKVIADRAKRLQNNPEKNEDDKVINKEFLEARMKLRARTEAK